jgi:hypothetical protein
MEVLETNHTIRFNDSELLALVDGLEMLGVAIHRGHEDYTQWDFEFVDNLIKQLISLTPYGDGDYYMEETDSLHNLPSDVEYEDN